MGELAPAAPSPGKEVAAATTDVTDEVVNAAGQVLTPTEERESSSLMDGSFSLLGEKTVNKIKTHKDLKSQFRTTTEGVQYSRLEIATISAAYTHIISAGAAEILRVGWVKK